MGCDASSTVEESALVDPQASILKPVRQIRQRPEPISHQPELLSIRVAQDHSKTFQQPEKKVNASISEEETLKMKEAYEHYKSSQYQKAIKLCQQLLVCNPHNDIALNQLGLCYYYLEEYDKSIQNYKKAIQINKSEDLYWYNIGKSYYYQQKYTDSIQAYRKAIEINPKIAYFHFDLGRSYYYNYQYQKGIESYRKGEELDPKNEAYSHQIGLCHYYLEDYAQAIDSFSRAIELAPTHHASMNHLGLCYYYQEDYPSAEQYFRRALQAAPRNSSYLWNLGRNYYYMEDYPRAIAAYEQCIELRPRDSSYEEEIAMCYFYMEDYDSALAWIGKALQKNPQKASTYAKKGLIYYYMEEYDQSIRQNIKSLQIDPRYFRARLGLANNYYYLQQYPKAIKQYLKCCESDNNGQVHERLGKSYYQTKQYEQALKHFDECLKLRPNYIESLILKGRCYFNMGQFNQSLQEFKKAKAVAASLKVTQPQTYIFYIHTINAQIAAGEEFQLKSKVGVITEEERQEVQKMRQSFENKIEKMFTFSVKDDKDKKRKQEVKKTTINRDILQIVKNLYQQTQLYNLSSQKVLTHISEIIKKMFLKDYGYFQIFAYIFEVYVWINKFKKKHQILEIEEELSQKIRSISAQNPPTQEKKDVNKEIDFPVYPEKKYNLFREKAQFQSYRDLIKEIERVNELSKQDLLPFKQLLFKVQRQSGGNHAKANMKLPNREQSKDQSEYQHKLFKVLLRIFEKIFKEQLQAKKYDMLKEIQEQIDQSTRIPIQKIIIIMMQKWIGYIDSSLKIRKYHKVPTQFFITDLVRGKCMFQDTEKIKEAVCSAIRISKQQSYQIMELDNRLHKSTQDVVMKIKIKHCVCELQLALDFDLTKFEFGHSFYEIERCSLGCIFGCSLFLAKEVNETFPELLFENEKAVKRARHIDEEAHKALDFVIKQLMESVKL